MSAWCLHVKVSPFWKGAEIGVFDINRLFKIFLLMHVENQVVLTLKKNLSDKSI